MTSEFKSPTTSSSNINSLRFKIGSWPFHNSLTPFLIGIWDLDDFDDFEGLLGRLEVSSGLVDKSCLEANNL